MTPSADDRARPALGHRDDRQAAGLGLEQHLAERVRAAGEEEHVGARVGAGELVAVQPAEERRVLAQARAQRALLGAAAGEAEVQARVARRAARNASASRSTPFSRLSRPA